jgi:hypothetical protein
MQIKRRKNKTINDRKQEIIKDFFRGFSGQKKPSRSGWFFASPSEEGDIKNELKSARAKLAQLYREETKKSSLGDPGDNKSVNSTYATAAGFIGNASARIKKASGEKAKETETALMDKTEKGKDQKEENFVFMKKLPESAELGFREEKEFEPLSEDDPKLISISEIAKTSRYKREYLGYLVRQKKLKAQKVFGNWMTTQEAVDEYLKEGGRSGGEVQKNLYCKPDI